MFGHFTTLWMKGLKGLISRKRYKNKQSHRIIISRVIKRRSSSLTLHQKWSFPLRISSVNVTQSAVSSEFCHIHWRNPQCKTSFFVQCNVNLFCNQWLLHYQPSVYISSLLDRIYIKRPRSSYITLSFKNIFFPICFPLEYTYKKALVIARLRVQYDQYFPSFSYFADLFHKPLGEWNNSKIWETRKILVILCDINVW